MIVFLKYIYEEKRAVWLDLFDSGDMMFKKDAAKAVVKCAQKTLYYREFHCHSPHAVPSQGMGIQQSYYGRSISGKYSPIW